MAKTVWAVDDSASIRQLVEVPAAQGIAGYDISFLVDETPADLSEVIDQLLDELRCHGSVAAIVRPGGDGDVWRVRIEDSSADATALRDIIEFVARSDSIRINRVGAPAPVEACDGRFDDEPVPGQREEAYGRFDAEPLPVPVEEACGRFEPEAPLAAVEPAKDRRGAARADDQPAAKASGDTSIRDGVERVDQLINMVGELVITQVMLAQAVADVDPLRFERLTAGLGQLERNIRNLAAVVGMFKLDSGGGRGSEPIRNLAAGSQTRAPQQKRAIAPTTSPSASGEEEREAF